MDRIIFVTEPLLSSAFVQMRFVLPLAHELRQEFQIAVAAPRLSPEVQGLLKGSQILPLDGGAFFPSPRHPEDEAPSYVLSWLRDSLLGLNARALARRREFQGALTVNLSMTTSLPSDVWYVQGRPLGPTLKAIGPSMANPLRSLVRITGPALGLVDNRYFARRFQRSRHIVTHGYHLARWFQERGVPVEAVLHSYLHPFTFEPTTANPSRDYALVYLGKETDMGAVRQLAASGVPLKAFGAKSSGWVTGPVGIPRSSRVEVLGRVSHEELRELYTHARVTAFPFTEEPFGLVPVESMACGTPVVTYGRQGPSETVEDGRTGWLVEDARALVATVQRIFREGYPADVPRWCRERAREFRLESAAQRWRGFLRACLDGTPLPQEVAYPYRNPLLHGITPRWEAPAPMR